MAGLQRSQTSFRRQGSSGLVWDDKFLSGELKKPDEETSYKGPKPLKIHRNRSNREHTYRTAKDVSPAIDPPSPKISNCGLCGIFGKSKPTQKPKSARHKP